MLLLCHGQEITNNCVLKVVYLVGLSTTPKTVGHSGSKYQVSVLDCRTMQFCDQVGNTCEGTYPLLTEKIGSFELLVSIYRTSQGHALKNHSLVFLGKMRYCNILLLLLFAGIPSSTQTFLGKLLICLKRIVKQKQVINNTAKI